MYEDFFGLTDQPFQLCTDPRYLFLSASHARAQAYLRYALLKPDGIVVVTGEIGTGKSTLISSVRANADADTDVAVLHQTQLNDVELLQSVLLALGLTMVPEGKAELLDNARELLSARHEQGRRTLLIVDDAHNLSASVLEELRMLADLEHASEPLLSLVLVGQPALRQTLAKSGLEQLRQRVRLNYRLEPLGKAATARYVRHRLQVAGNVSLQIFPPECEPLIYRYTGGVPRRINLLCDMAMTAASLGGRRTVSPQCVVDAVRELGWQTQPYRWRVRRAYRRVRNGLLERRFMLGSLAPRPDSHWPVPNAAHAMAGLRRLAQVNARLWAALRRFAVGAAAALALVVRAFAADWDRRPRLASVAAALPLLLMPLFALAVAVMPAGRPPGGAAMAPAESGTGESGTGDAALTAMSRLPAEQAVVVLASHQRDRLLAASAEMGPPAAPELAKSAASVTTDAGPPTPPGPDAVAVVASATSATGERIDGLRSTEWILSQQPQSYTIQILGTRRPQSLQRFAARHASDLTLAYFAVARDDRDWFVLVAGTYPSLSAARAARTALPEAIRHNGPWIRKFGDIQTLLRDAGRVGQAAEVHNTVATPDGL